MDYPTLRASLLVPFPLAEVKFRPQSVPKDAQSRKFRSAGRCLLMAYGDPRSYTDRLNEVCPGSWEVDTLQMLGVGRKLVVSVNVTIADIVHSNVGEADVEDANAATRAFAQGFKRACADHGLGRYFYALKGLWVDFTCDDGGTLKYATPPLPAWATPDGYLKLKGGPAVNGAASESGRRPTNSRPAKSTPV